MVRRCSFWILLISIITSSAIAQIRWKENSTNISRITDSCAPAYFCTGIVEKVVTQIEAKQLIEGYLSKIKAIEASYKKGASNKTKLADISILRGQIIQLQETQVVSHAVSCALEKLKECPSAEDCYHSSQGPQYLNELFPTENSEGQKDAFDGERVGERTIRQQSKPNRKGRGLPIGIILGPLEELGKHKKKVDKYLTKRKADIDKTLTKSKNDIDRAATKAWEDVTTEWNYFWASVCGESTSMKKVKRDFDQKKITKQQYEKLKQKYENRKKECGGGYQVSSDGDNRLLDRYGQPSDIILPSEMQENWDATLAWIRKMEFQDYMEKMDKEGIFLPDLPFQTKEEYESFQELVKAYDESIHTGGKPTVEQLKLGNLLMAYARGAFKGSKESITDMVVAIYNTPKMVASLPKTGAALLSFFQKTSFNEMTDMALAKVGKDWQQFKLAPPEVQGEVLGKVVTDILSAYIPLGKPLEKLGQVLSKSKDFLRIAENSSVTKHITGIMHASNEVANKAPELEKVMEYSGVLRDAAKNKGNFNLGTLSQTDIDIVGKAWVGKNPTRINYRNNPGEYVYVSSDGLRQYRPPTLKTQTGKIQANLEWRNKKSGQWQGDGHIDIKAKE